MHTCDIHVHVIGKDLSFNIYPLVEICRELSMLLSWSNDPSTINAVLSTCSVPSFVIFVFHIPVERCTSYHYIVVCICTNTTSTVWKEYAPCSRYGRKFKTVQYMYVQCSYCSVVRSMDLTRPYYYYKLKTFLVPTVSSQQETEMKWCHWVWQMWTSQPSGQPVNPQHSPSLPPSQLVVGYSSTES